MHFIETPTFRRVCDDLLSLEDFRTLQLALYDNPEAGDVISGTAGLRKIRVARAGHGKRGGARAYYYWHVPGRTVWLLYCTRRTWPHRPKIRNASLANALAC